MKLLAPIEYQVKAESAFNETRARLQSVLPDARFEHVGSSSIPGLHSKGDVDICVLVHPKDHSQTIATLERLGYTIKLGTLRTPELCMLESPQMDIELALQVVAIGSKFEFFLQFRDALLADQTIVAQYNALKLLHTDAPSESYRAAKAEFIAKVLHEA